MSGAPLEGFEKRFAEVKAVRMRYFVAGDGPPVVCVHGFGGAAANWSELAPLLARRFRVLVPDLPGHAGSSPLPAAPNLEAYAERVRLVAEREDMLPAALVGHSMGGLVALRFAIRHADATSALVLAASAGIESATDWARFWVHVFALVRPAKRIAPAQRLVERSALLRRLVFNPVTVADPLALSPRAVDGYLGSMSLHTDMLSAARALVADDPRLELDAVGCPALVLWGARDREVPVGDAFELARRLRAPVRTIADCGHLLISERPDACNDAIESFLATPMLERG